MTPYLTDPDVTLHQGDSLEVLRSMPDASVHMACTSPPFFGLRDYGTGTWEGGDEEGCAHRTEADEKPRARPELPNPPSSWAERDVTVSRAFNECKCGARRIDSQIGLESSPDEWASRLVDVFREVRRVLRDDGTLWVECGDSYAATHHGKGGNSQSAAFNDPGDAWRDNVVNQRRQFDIADGLKPKDLIGQPWLLAFALRADGWFLRSCIIWSKPNAMPESVTDRPTTGHSYVFLFSKRAKYFYDAEGVREPHINPARYEKAENRETWTPRGDNDSKEWNPKTVFANPNGKNARTVWTIPTEPNALAICRVCDAYWQGGAPREHCGEPVVQHFAAFPRELVRRMILAGTSERGVCAECGAPWVREVERDLVATKGKVGEHAGEGRADPMDSGSNQVWSGGVYGRYDVTTLGWHSSCDCQVRGEVLRGKTTPQQHSEASLAYLAPVPAVVLDCFSGSGTTLLVARSLGRYSVGIELNERYAAMTRARMSQLSLLSELA